MRSLLIAFASIVIATTTAFSAKTAPESFVGDWEGTLDVGAPIRVLIHLVYSDGKWSGTTDSPDQGSVGVPLSEVSVKGNDLYWALDSVEGEYRGTLSKDGKQIEGTLTQAGHPMPLTFARVVGAAVPPTPATSTPAANASPFAGDWAGMLEAANLRLAVHLAITNGVWTGSMASIDQGAGHMPFTAVSVDGNKLHLEIKAINGTYDGTLDEKSQTITGTWTQNGNVLPLDFARGEASAIPAPKRPQEPKPPFPYRSEEVTVPGPGGNTLAGTFTAPNGNGPFPAVFLITGSGAQNRNEELMGHKPFLVLSDYLTRNGIAVLRCDDRGFGKSTGDANGTSEDFAQDAEAAVAYLKTRVDVDAKKIGLVGHSEGGIVAPIVAARSQDVAYIVMMAGVGVPAQDLLVRQFSDLTRAGGASDAVVNYTASAVRRMCQIAARTTDEKLRQQQLNAVADSLTAQISALDPAKTQMISQQAHGVTELIGSAWSRYLLTLKPDETLRKVKQPVLAINGSLDLQVSAKENLPAIEKALKAGGNKDVTTTELPGLNHLFQSATTGVPAEYGSIEETMSPVALKTISDWIVAHTTPKKK